ncbi:MAG: AbrB/MazE/SpoVT family DNA-binding domain-containing protein [Bdellovibrionales bacterium]
MQQQHHTRLQNGGRIVVPVAFRQAMKVTEGDELVLRLDESGLHVYSARQALEKARSMVDQYVGQEESLVDELIADRRKEAADE